MAEMSLYTEINKALVTCPITNNQYLPSHTVRDKITVERVKGSVTVRFKRISLLQAFRDRGVAKRVQRAKRIISILALIDKLNKKSMKALAPNKLTDDHLPLVRDGKQLKCRCHGNVFLFPSLGEGDIDRFIKQQWMVIAPRLNFKAESATSIQLEENCAFQFSHVEMIYDAEFSEVYEAKYPFTDEKVKESFLHLAVKKFIGRDKETQYEKEKQNLGKIESFGINNRHLLKHLGVCDRVHCIIFPWADGKDLDLLWGEARRKKNALDTCRWSLEQLVGLSHALHDLHCANIRHGDLKPSNILHFINNEDDGGILKIADVGVSKAHTIATDHRRKETTTRASTLVYEGPEASDPERNKTPRSRKFDCWSMGCIMLEFIIWILYDSNAIEGFAQSRGRPNRSYYEPKPGVSSGIARWWETVQRHRVVDEAIDLLLKDDRCRGTLLEKLIEIADRKLLVIKPDQRASATQLHAELQGLLESCRNGSIKYMNNLQRDTVPQIFAKKWAEPGNNSIPNTSDVK